MTMDRSVTLIPGLPNDVAAFILSLIPYCQQPRLKGTCKSWRLFLSSASLPSLRRRHGHLSPLLCLFPQDPSLASPFLFDPLHLSWRPLPSMPCNPHTYALSNFSSLSLGPHLYVLGGSLFDARSFPIDRPSPSPSVFRLNFLSPSPSWEPLSPMLTPRGSFACVALPGENQILVAGGGCRHTMFAAAGSTTRCAERYDVGTDVWVPLEGLPSSRAGCVGFVVGDGERRDFWVMGGYGASRTISGIFPVDDYCKNAVVMGLGKDGSEWREVGNMWRDGERMRVGKIVVVQQDNGGCPGVFMLEGDEILRYDMSSNHWDFETRVPRKSPCNSSFGFVALHGELYVMMNLNAMDVVEPRRNRRLRRGGTLYFQIYHPKKRVWRSLATKLPFDYSIDINNVVLSSISL